MNTPKAFVGGPQVYITGSSNAAQGRHQSSMSAIPGPTKMLVVDSNIFPGEITEIPLDGHTLVTGTNAAGKTSLIQLIPLFLGVSPNTISNKRQGKSFYSHYLPNSSSYVAFEYRHRDGHPRSVIIHASMTDDQPRFRFVRSALYEDMFVNDNGDYVASSDLARHLRLRGYDVAEKAIDTLTDYKTIIFGSKISEGKHEKKQFISRMVANYTVSQRSRPLVSADRVAFAMLKKDASLPALESMIAEKLLGDEQEIQVSGDQKTLERWPAKYTAYLDVMSKEEDVRNLERMRASLSDWLNEEARARGELAAIQDQSAAELEVRKATEARLIADRDRKADAYQEKKSEAHQATSDALSQKVHAEDKILAIERHHGDGVTAGLPAKVKLADRKTDIEHQLKTDRARLNALVGKRTDLTAAFDTQKDGEREKARLDAEKVQEDEDRLRDARDENVDQARRRHEHLSSAIHSTHEKSVEDAEEAVTSAREELAAAREAGKTPSVPQEVLDQQTAAQAEVTKAMGAYTAALRERTPLEDELRVAKNAADKAIDDLQKTAAKINTKKDQRDIFEQQKKPRDGSLLSFLRDEMPDWSADIARTINPALLELTDLNPRLGTGRSIYGLELDLSTLKPAQEADLSEIDAVISRLQAELDDLHEAESEQRAALGKITKTRTTAQTALSEHVSSIAILEGKIAPLQKTLAARSRDVETARENAKSIAKERIASAITVLAAMDTAKKAVIDARDLDISNEAARVKHELSKIAQDYKADLAVLTARRSAIRTDLKQKIKDLNDQLARALSEEGVDPAEITQLNTDIEEAQSNLERIAKDATQVASWRNFLEYEYKGLAGVKTDRDIKERAWSALVEAEADIQTSWAGIKSQLDQAVKDERGAIADLTALIAKAERRLAASPDAARITPTKIIRTLDEAIQNLNDAERESKTLFNKIRVGVREVALAFLREESSPPAQHLTEAKTTLPIQEGPEWIPTLVRWFDVDHEAHRSKLMTDARLIANKIKLGHERLLRFDRQIKSENLSLQKSLNDNNRLNVVTELGVTIVSTIQKLEFIRPMKTLSDLHEDWVRSGDLLPPEGFAQAMKDIMAFWKGGEGITANLRNQVRIEGHVVENGNRREFSANTDLGEISSNGVSYLILTIILVGFVNMVRGKEPLHMVWALDELGSIDSYNTRRLLDMLRENNITLIAATPSSEASVRDAFDYRLKFIPGPRLADVKNASQSAMRLTWSRSSATPPDVISELEDGVLGIYDHERGYTDDSSGNEGI